MSDFASGASTKRLTRRPEEGKFGGVCAGLAAYFDADVALVRAAWVILSIWPGAIVLGCVAYVAAWLLMPKATDAAPVGGHHLVRSTADRRVAGVCGGLADYFTVDPTIVRVTWVIVSIVPGAIVFGIVAYLVAWFIIPQAPTATLAASPSMP